MLCLIASVTTAASFLLPPPQYTLICPSPLPSPPQCAQLVVRLALLCLSALLRHPPTHSWLLPLRPKFLGPEGAEKALMQGVTWVLGNT